MYAIGETKEQIREYIIKEAIDKIAHRCIQILNAIEETGVIIDEVEYYVTDCLYNRRKKINPDYKANRKRNSWVYNVRKKLIESGLVISDLYLEADDLIADRAAELQNDYIIVSIDKDLETIKGLHFNYYAIKDEEGNFLQFKGLNYVTEFEADKKLALMMLTGDTTDNIKGLPKIGKVKGAKLIDSCTTRTQLLFAVYRAYYRHSLINPEFEYFEQLTLNYKMLKLGA